MVGTVLTHKIWLLVKDLIERAGTYLSWGLAAVSDPPDPWQDLLYQVPHHPSEPALCTVQGPQSKSYWQNKIVFYFNFCVTTLAQDLSAPWALPCKIRHHPSLRTQWWYLQSGMTTQPSQIYQDDLSGRKIMILMTKLARECVVPAVQRWNIARAPRACSRKKFGRLRKDLWKSP